MKQTFKEFIVGLEDLDVNEQLSMYNDYEFNFENTTDITINIVEVASELADNELERLQNESLYKDGQNLYFPNGIVQEDPDDENTTIYTEEAQDKFNELYDWYYSFLEGFKIK